MLKGANLGEAQLASVVCYVPPWNGSLPDQGPLAATDGRGETSCPLGAPQLMHFAGYALAPFALDKWAHYIRKANNQVTLSSSTGAGIGLLRYQARK